MKNALICSSVDDGDGDAESVEVADACSEEGVQFGPMNLRKITLLQYPFVIFCAFTIVPICCDNSYYLADCAIVVATRTLHSPPSSHSLSRRHVSHLPILCATRYSAFVCDILTNAKYILLLS